MRWDGAVLLVVAWLVGWWLCGRVRTMPPVDGPEPPTPISVVIPARDEAAALPTLLEGLRAQRVPPDEVIVVDDGSQDATANVAARLGARVLAAPPLPDGWTGKSWALWTGARAARADVLVLLDADVEPGPDLLARLGALHEANGGLVSVQPYHRMRRWWERASAFFNLVPVMSVGLGSPSWPRRRQITVAFGPVVVCRRDLYLAHGDDPSVRAAVVEDVALARAVAAAGHPVRALAGGGAVAFRMYDRPSRLVEGWTKNLASGARTVPPVRLVLVAGWITACLVSGGWLLGGTVAALAVYAAFALQCFVQLRQLGSFGVVTALLYPVLAIVFVVLFFASLAFVARGEVRWKGRRISLRATERAG
jgi:4,4'-diaponeurosporenoate glycosyltransferase